MPRTILIIDDDRELCDLVGELLRGEGFEVDARHSGAGAIELAVGGRYELVILDVMLPEQNGFEILRAVRRRSAVPVILLTARGEDVDRIDATETHARIVVRDHGPGVPPDHIERIFLPFHRVGASRDRESGGAGLGLSIAARAATVHGGSIHAINASNGGLQVTIAIPLA